MIRWLVAAILTTLLVGWISVVQAQVQAEQHTVKITKIQAARLLIKAGRLPDAKALLETIKPTGEKATISKLFLLGLVALRLEKPREAARHLKPFSSSSHI